MAAMKPQSFSSLQPKIVLGIAAHPDDLDFSASGTLAAFAADGAAVHYLQVTDGCKGSTDPESDCASIANTRAQEQRLACDRISGVGVHFLNHIDGELEVTQELKKQLVRAIRTIKPDVIITTDPTLVYSTRTGMINHADHRACGEATLDAVYPLARDHLSYPELLKDEGLAAHKVKTVLLINHDTANFYVDITQTMEVKLQAINAHASQFPDQEATRRVVTELAAEYGEQANCRYAEGFVRLEMLP